MRTNDRLFLLGSYFYVLCFSLICILPFWLMFMGSITAERELFLEGYQFFPDSINWAAYKLLLSSSKVWNHYMVTTFITVVGTSLGLIFTSAVAYSIANKRNHHRNKIALFVYLPMLFSGGLIPYYILVSKWLHLSDSLWALILPSMVSGFNVFVMVAFFRNLPEEIGESGMIDGANEAYIFFKLIIPISTPVMATISLFLAINFWNEWFNALLFISDESKFPLQLMLRRLVSNLEAAKNLVPQANLIINVPSLQIRMATTFVTIGPIILFYPFIQRHFVKGLTIGAIKG